MTVRTAPADYPIHELLAKRWSPRAFEPKAIPEEVLKSLFEAARWSASCSNEQPWAFLVIDREDESQFHLAKDCLEDGNSIWARHASALIFTLARDTFASNGKPNPYAWYDVGAASAQLALQAEAMGLNVHPMAGFFADRVRQHFHVPQTHTPVSAIAVGYLAKPDGLPDYLKEREVAPRTRFPQTDFVHWGDWGDTG